MLASMIVLINTDWMSSSFRSSKRLICGLNAYHYEGPVGAKVCLPVYCLLLFDGIAINVHRKFAFSQILAQLTLAAGRWKTNSEFGISIVWEIRSTLETDL